MNSKKLVFLNYNTLRHFRTKRAIPTKELLSSEVIKELNSKENTSTSSFNSYSLMTQPSFVIGRQVEMLNIFMGYEQANKYSISNINGETIGYIMEEAGSIGNAFKRQLFGKHRPLTATILDREGVPQLIFKRPFYFISSSLEVYKLDNGNEVFLGSVSQRWHPFRRKYDLFEGNEQFAEIDMPLLSWDFNITDEKKKTLALVNKNFTGIAREIFTDTSQYLVDLPADTNLTAAKKSIVIGCAVSIDCDYFSKLSGGPGLFPFFFIQHFHQATVRALQSLLMGQVQILHQ